MRGASDDGRKYVIIIEIDDFASGYDRINAQLSTK